MILKNKKKEQDRIEFTRSMRKDYTILIPMMAPIHFELLKNVFRNHGYKLEILNNDGPSVVEEGLKYVHNDICYPALLVIGQMIDALKSGKYDLEKTALMITQTGGGCRASNYIHLLRKALVKAGYGKIPVISLNLSGLERNSGFKLTLTLLRKSIAALVYGDLLMLLDNQVKPYEKHLGDSRRMVSNWVNRLSEQFSERTGYTLKTLRLNLESIADSFSKIPTVTKEKIKVGIVGEIFVKYASLANNHLEDFLASQGCEVMVPGLLEFILFKTDNRLEDIKLYGGSRIKKGIVSMLMNYLSKMEQQLIDVVQKYDCFTAPSPYQHLKELVKDVIGHGCKMGEGWLLTAEMLELIEHGYDNIVCAQPFGCLPNHIVGKGMIRKIKTIHENANICAIDYDPGATKVNQENRIKLMLAVAREKALLMEKRKPKENHDQAPSIYLQSAI
jgi:predicted nucleotide-binding protein (sugar kinase/HSP70/actin superfamily)